MTKTVLISGVTGQDGSYMADYLLANTTHRILGMIRRTAKPDYSNLAKALQHPDRFQLVVGDLSDSQSIDNLLKQHKPDYLINLAAQSFVGASWQLPEQTMDVTGVGLLRILEAVRKHAPHCRTYSAGSSEQFGDVAYSPQDEKHPQRPRSPYGAAKCLASHITKVYRESYGLYAVHGILFNHESPRRGEEFVTRKITLGVARIAAAIRAGQPFEPIELGNIDAKRDWSHAEDFVDGIWRMLNQEPPAENVAEVTINGQSIPGLTPLVLGWDPQEYVLSSDSTHTVREFVEKAFSVAEIHGDWMHGFTPQDETYQFVCAIFRKDGWIERPENIEGIDKPLVRINPAFYRPAEVDLLWGDSTRARAELGWSPKHSFDDLVTEMVRADLAAVGITT